MDKGQRGWITLNDISSEFEVCLQIVDLRNYSSLCHRIWCIIKVIKQNMTSYNIVIICLFPLAPPRNGEQQNGGLTKMYFLFWVWCIWEILKLQTWN